MTHAEREAATASALVDAAKAGDVWSCMKGMPEANANTGSTVAIMRVIDLIARA